MSAKFFLPILLFFYSQISQSQPLTLDWLVEDSTYAPNSLEYDRVITDLDGNVYLCTQGVPTGPGLMSSSILTRKYSPSGGLIWQAKLDNTYADRFYDCAFDKDGSFIVSGQRGTPPMIFGDRAEVASYHPGTGEEQWRTFLFDTLAIEAYLLDLDLDNDGNVFAFGNYNDDNSIFDSLKAFVAKIDHSTGVVLWWQIVPGLFSCSKGKLSDDGMRIVGTKKGVPGYYVIDTDLDGNVVDSSNLPSQYVATGQYDTYIFFEPSGHFVTVGHKIIKWEVSPDPLWSFDFSLGLPNTVGQAQTAVSDNSGNIYATGYLYDSLADARMTQTLKLSPEGDLIWVTVKDFDEIAGWEAGMRIAASDHHVFVNTMLNYGENGNFSDDYQIALYSQEDGAIIHDTLIDGNERDIPYYAHYGNGHFYLLGRSYIDFSTDPADYKYKLYSFTADEPVSATEEGVTSPAPVVFPNPTMGTFRISQPGSIQFDKLVLYDGQGKSVLTRNIIANHQEFNLPGLPDGVYLLQLNGEGAAHTARLVVASPR